MVAASFGKISTPAPIIVQQSAQTPVLHVEQHLHVESVTVKEGEDTHPYPVSLEKNRTTDSNSSNSSVSVTANQDCSQDSGKSVSPDRDPSVLVKTLESQDTETTSGRHCVMEQSKQLEQQRDITQPSLPKGDCVMEQSKQLEQQWDRTLPTLPSDNKNINNMLETDLPRKKKAEPEAEPSRVSKVKPLAPVVRSKRLIRKRKRCYKDPSIPTVYNCRLCNVEFQKYNKYLEHNQTHVLLYSDLVHSDDVRRTYDRIIPAPSDQLTCPICARTFATTRQKKDHILRMHPGPDELYKCKLCENKITSKKSMQSHLLGHAMYLCNKYQCIHCEKKYSSRASLSCHMKKHTASKPQCPHCAKTFATRGSLTYHIDVMHLGKDVKKHMCDVCGKLFPRQSELEAHKVIHSEARNHLCDICGKTFKKLQNLGFHMKVHVKPTPSEAVKSHSCGICSKRFVRLTALADHVTVVHEKECILCGASIASKKVLLEHRRLCKRDRKNCHSWRAKIDTSQDVMNPVAEGENMTTDMESDKSENWLDSAQKSYEKTRGTVDVKSDMDIENTDTSSDSSDSDDSGSVNSANDSGKNINNGVQNKSDFNQTRIDVLLK